MLSRACRPGRFEFRPVSPRSRNTGHERGPIRVWSTIIPGIPHPELQVGPQHPTDASLLTGCATSGCGWKCCQFMQGNYIVMYPGELEAAREAGESTAHLNLLATDKFGGLRATCNAADTANCDGGYKPIDCSTYPLFPQLDIETSDDPDTLRTWLKGSKCPLGPADVQAHLLQMSRAWRTLIASDPRIAPWLKAVRLVGYERFERHGDGTSDSG